MLRLLAIMDIVAAVVLLWANQRITTKAGLMDRQARWALFRRVMYSVTAFSLFVLGINRLFFDRTISNIEVLAQLWLLVYIIIFPIMRAAGFITQDLVLSLVRDSGGWWHQRR
jgi:hypothetical protein